MSDRKSSGAAGGITLGAAMAATISWSIHHSFWWMLLHGVCGWFYIIAYGLEFVTQWEVTP